MATNAEPEIGAWYKNTEGESFEVIAMDDEPGSSVRRKKDSSLVRAAELVRDGRASAMVAAGNTGATMAWALRRMSRPPTRPAAPVVRRRPLVPVHQSSDPA